MSIEKNVEIKYPERSDGLVSVKPLSQPTGILNYVEITYNKHLDVNREKDKDSD